MKKATRPRHILPRPMDLRRETVQQLTARLLLLGWSVSRIARRLHCTDRAVRWRMRQPDFQALFDEIQQEHFKTVDRKLGSLLHGAVDALERLLRHSDWKARDAALQHIFAIHGKYVQRYDVTGQLGLAGQMRHVQAEIVDGSMTDEMRSKARELLALQRQMFQRSLPARFANHEDNPLERDRDVTGRFTSNGHGDD